MTMQQQALFDPATSANTGFRDSAFVRNRELPVHRWVPWIAGFSAQFVDDCLSKYLPVNGKTDRWVLDPFAGVGTTLVQAYAHGFNVVGFEINPYAALASKAKLEAASVSAAALRAQVVGFQKFMKRKCVSTNGCPRSTPPPGFSGRTELFSPAVERKVLFALDYIKEIQERAVRDLFRLAFGSVMVSFSNYLYEPSLTRRCAVDKDPIEETDVGEIVSSKVSLMADDVEWLQEEIHKTKRNAGGSVYADSLGSCHPGAERRISLRPAGLRATRRRIVWLWVLPLREPERDASLRSA